jgi:hypothetical protein
LTRAGTAVAEIDNDEASAALAAANTAAAQVAAAQAEEYDDDLIHTPILKIGQGLTREVQEGDASPGEFINTLTSEGLGDTIDFVCAYYNKGRFASDKDSGRAYVAFQSTIPASWEPLVGAEWVGENFTEYPEAEEMFKAAVNAKEREWGHGPLVSTTHNFTGLVLVEVEKDVVEPQPVRLSLKRVDVPAARKITTLQRTILRNKSPWDVVLRLTTTKKEFGKNAAYIINPADVKVHRQSTDEEKIIASEIALAVMGGRTRTTGAEDADRPTEPADTGGLAV